VRPVGRPGPRPLVPAPPVRPARWCSVAVGLPLPAPPLLPAGPPKAGLAFPPAAAAEGPPAAANGPPAAVRCAVCSRACPGLAAVPLAGGRLLPARCKTSWRAPRLLRARRPVSPRPSRPASHPCRACGGARCACRRSGPATYAGGPPLRPDPGPPRLAARSRSTSRCSFHRARPPSRPTRSLRPSRSGSTGCARCGRGAAGRAAGGRLGPDPRLPLPAAAPRLLPAAAPQGPRRCRLPRRSVPRWTLRRPRRT
jgi:hypothetical protein